MIRKGHYEQLINNEIKKELEKLSEHDKIKRLIDDVDNSNLPGLLTSYLSEIIEFQLRKRMEREEGHGKAQEIRSLINQLIDLLASDSKEESSNLRFDSKDKFELLLALLDDDSNIKLEELKDSVRPMIPMYSTHLFTGEGDWPSFSSELQREIQTADSIDLLVSFIRWSGLRTIIRQLEEFTKRGGHLRVITTAFLGATQSMAIDRLSKLDNTEIKISYDVRETRMHAKAYIFHRNTGFSTAYIGSANMSKDALTSGLEWNFKMSEKNSKTTWKKITGTFDTYWNSKELVMYDESERENLQKALNRSSSRKENYDFSFIIEPYSFQKQILETLESERINHDRWKNLVVAATGTGKTVISAFDYRNFRKNNPKNDRILYIAHRKEILDQALSCFRGILRDQNFGDLLYGGEEPKTLNYLFATIQSVNSSKLMNRISPDHYGYIVIDEFHHAAAGSYENVLSYFKPKILLGLTATPERMDGLDIRKYFENKIASEIRLPDAIDRHLLSPFQYFGVTDNVDLSHIEWRGGKYDPKELENQYVNKREQAESRALLIYDALKRYILDINSVKGVGFCVSKNHAKYMSEFFNRVGVPSMYLVSETAREERDAAKNRLRNGEVNFIFVVDLYNEGVDIPEINTVLFLRPTESLTVFLQQLGRGLRLYEGKECLTVLDFIGQANKLYNFESRFGALIRSNRSVVQAIEHDFDDLPSGCFIQLEKIATRYVLDNVKQYFNRKQLVDKIYRFRDETGETPNLASFLKRYELKPLDIYRKDTFIALCAEAFQWKDVDMKFNDKMTKAFQKLTYVDSKRWIKFILNQLDHVGSMDFGTTNDDDKRMLNMFRQTVWSDSTQRAENDQVRGDFQELADNGHILQEMKDLLSYNLENITVQQKKMDFSEGFSLDLHSTYTRDQILIGLGHQNVTNMREGVLYLKHLKTDVFLITLNKSDRDFSPSTMYDDYSVNEELFHWQSQSTTNDISETGKRYINHKNTGNKIALFVREYKKDGQIAMPYTFLGFADYVKHDGNKPMNILWKMHDPIPAKLISKTNRFTLS